MSQFGETAKGASASRNSYYEHTILISDSFLSKLELFTFLPASVSLYFGFYRYDDIGVSSNLKIIGLFLYCFLSARLVARFFCGVKSESILIVKALGLQTTTVYYSTLKTSKFIPWHSISDVVINEAFVMQRVIFYLGVLVKGDHRAGGESLIPVFTNARPRLSELKHIYESVQAILSE